MQYNHRSKIIRAWDGSSSRPVPELRKDIYFPSLADSKIWDSVMKAMDLSARVEDLYAVLNDQLDEDLLDLMLQCHKVGEGLATAHELIMAKIIRLNHGFWSTEIVVPDQQGSKFSYRLRPFASGGQFHLSSYQYNGRGSTTFVAPSMVHVQPEWDTASRIARAGAMVNNTLIMTNRAPENGCYLWQFFTLDQSAGKRVDIEKFATNRDLRERWAVEQFCTKLDLSRVSLGDDPVMLYEDLEAITNLLRMNHELMVTAIIELHLRVLLTASERAQLPTGTTKSGRPVSHKRFASIRLDPNVHIRPLTDEIMLVPLGSRYEPWTFKALSKLYDKDQALWAEVVAGLSTGYPELVLWQRRHRDPLPVWDTRRLPISGIDKRRETVYTGRSRVGR